MRILLSLKEVAGFYVGLKKGLELNGVQVDFVPLEKHRFGYDEGISSQFVLFKIIRFINNKKFESNSPIWFVIHHVIRIVFLFFSLVRYDVIVFGFGVTFINRILNIPNPDLILFKIFRIKVLFQFHGSDSRPPYINGAFIQEYSKAQIKHLSKFTSKKIIKINKYAFQIIDIPPQGYFHRRRYINWMKIGIPVTLVNNRKEFKFKENLGVIRILHSPSNPLVKGSDYIQKIINELIQEGHNIKYIIIQGQPNKVVIQELEKCDFVIDQVYADYGMPGFACEAAAMGKPVIISGNSVELWKSILKDEDKLPSIYCHHQELKRNIKKLIMDHNYRRQKAYEHYKFVNVNWHPKQVASKYISIISGKAKESWFLNPYDFKELNGGYFMNLHDFKNFLSDYVNEYGLKSLFLSDKGDLQKNIMLFISNTTEDK